MERSCFASASSYNVPLTRIDHVQLAMPPGGEAQARQFYVDVLGLREIAKPPHLAKRGGAWFLAANVAGERARCYIDDPFGNRIEIVEE